MKKRNLVNSILVQSIVILAATCLSPIAHAGDYIYTQLKMKDYDEMLSEVKARIVQAEKISTDDLDGAKAKLRDALQLIFSRPNSDNMVSQLVVIVRTPLRNLEAYETTMAEVALEALNKAKDKSAKLPERATGFVMLENIMSELKPDVKNKPEMREIFAGIQNAKLVTPEDVKRELRMKGMLKVPDSPSALAAKILGNAK